VKLQLLHKNPQVNLYIAKLDNTFKAPYFSGGVSAGFPSPAEDHMHAKLDLNELLITHPSATYYVRVVGDSMLEAGILSGDLLVVDRSVEVKNNSIVVAYVDGEFTVKRFQKIVDKIYLKAENKQYKSIEIKKDMDFEIFGVVIHAIHHFI
tara:strand:- start:24 stop:476 length:453 start_codon:yes stop_codon:yes gene_type:complete